MCYACLASQKEASWASFAHFGGQLSGLSQEDSSARNGDLTSSLLNEGTYWASMAQGAPFLENAYDWLNESVSGLPLGIFSAASAALPNVAIGNTKYYVPLNIDHDVLAVFSGSQWASSTITYSFPDSRWDYELINVSASGYKPLSDIAQQVYFSIFEGAGGGMNLTSVESFTNVNFVYAGRNNADIKISAYEPNDFLNRSHAYYPGVPIYGGDTWINDLNRNAPIPGNAMYYVLLHELGHALGLKHSHESGGNIPKMSAAHDSTEYTVMSYNVTSSPQTFMMYDIAALQEMYGADFTTNAGDTVYTWKPTTGETFVNGVSQGQVNGDDILLTVWDGGGNDTYNFESYASNLVVDLTPGGFSVLAANQRSGIGYGLADGNVYNALQYHGDARSLIENAIGGSGNDSITGNNANNMLIGNAGNDSLYGGAGSDKMWGGAGADFFDGGTWDDVVTYDDSPTGLILNLGNTYASTGIAQGDTYVSVEIFEVSRYADTIFGTAARDVIYANYGNDVVCTFEGNDFLDGQGGDDQLDAGAGDDYLFGGAGNDKMWGGAGADKFDGGDGVDTVSYDDSATGLILNLGNTYASTGIAQGDTYVSVEIFEGSRYADVILGTAARDVIYANYGDDVVRTFGGNDFLDGQGGNDQLDGGEGNDYLVGGEGNDTLWGGLNDDTLTGGAGSDLFVVEANGGHDVITDFGLGDVLRLTGITANVAKAAGANTEIQTADGRWITLQGIAASQLKGGVVNGHWEWHL